LPIFAEATAGSGSGVTPGKLPVRGVRGWPGTTIPVPRPGIDADGIKAAPPGTKAEVGFDNLEPDGNLACRFPLCGHSASIPVESTEPRRNHGGNP